MKEYNIIIMGGMIMEHSYVNFPMIAKALTVTMDAIKSEMLPSESGLQELKRAQKEFHKALSFSFVKKQ